MSNTEFILENATVDSLIQMIKERFNAAIDMEYDLKHQVHHNLAFVYNREIHDELVKRLWNAPLKITIGDNGTTVIGLIEGTDPKHLCHALDNYNNLVISW